MLKKNQKTNLYIENKKRHGLYGADFLLPEHPGETLKDELGFFGLSQKDLAEKMGYSAQTVNRIIKGTENITTDIALALERVFDGSPTAEFWLNMQSHYDQLISKKRELEETEAEVVFFKKAIKDTFKELQRGGVFGNYLLNTRLSYKKAVIDIKNFFGSYSLESISEEAFLGVAFRTGHNKNVNINKYNLAAILKVGDRKVKNILKNNIIPEYNKKDFLKKLPEIKKLSNKSQKDFLDLLQKQCLEFGVVVIYVPKMSNTFFGGATMWIVDHPVILLKVENQWEDTFWFNFFHEVGHIMKHGKKKVFVNFDDFGEKNEIELEADKFATDILYPDFDEINNKINKGVSLDNRIAKIAHEAGVSKSIIAGKICKMIGSPRAYKRLNTFRPTIKEKIGFLN